MGTPHDVDPLALATPALLLLWIAALLALLLWRRHIRNAPIAAYADILRRASRARRHAAAMIAWHILGGLVLLGAFGLLSWPAAAAGLPLLLIPAFGIRKWARTARTLTRILHSPTPHTRAQLRT
ncbi:hypothetical protein [Microbacterium sp. SCN 69-37]|jgi:hypothetical protein|uniref:hypothetical protein n=1 Tax=Microbacterium sp. SCN 69-37 TaxID=1660115 RepID=UPI00086B80AF|nr:hypothetical protein [Microbacterium sp. SCN 69-37]ODT25563.1 MAG: hypothetical protein ABS64_01365 [Microbacterium sp. SCN 69-37]